MDSKICLDSDILINLLRRDEDTKELLESFNANFCITTISTFEIWYGRKNEETIKELIDCLENLNFNKNAAMIAADISKELKKKGKLIDIRDLFIASICINNKIPLLTKNKKHFDRLKKYGLELI